MQTSELVGSATADFFCLCKAVGAFLLFRKTSMAGWDFTGMTETWEGKGSFLPRSVSSPASPEWCSKCDRSRGHLRGFSTTFSPVAENTSLWVVLVLAFSLPDVDTAEKSWQTMTIRAQIYQHRNDSEFGALLGFPLLIEQNDFIAIIN